MQEISTQNRRGQSVGEFLGDMTNNVGADERVVSAFAGTGLIGYGLSKGGVFGAALTVLGGGMLYRGATGHCHLYSAVEKTTTKESSPRIHVNRSVTINRAPAELYGFWRNFENLPLFMNHLEAVTIEDEKRSHWKARAPLGMTVEWDAEATGEVENERISWHSVEGSEIANSGVVEFRPTRDRGTEVRVTLTYDPPAGKLGAMVARLFGEEPSQQIAEDLRRFKSLMETGQIIKA